MSAKTGGGAQAEGGAKADVTVLRTLREMPSTVRVLMIGNLVSNLAAFLNAFLVLYLLHEGFTAWESGVVLTALMVGRILGSAAGGTAADRFGYRWTIIGSTAATAALTAAIVYVPNVWVGVLVAGGAGLTATSFRPAAMARVVELTPDERQVMTFSIWRATFNIGSTLGPLGAALLLTWFGSYVPLFFADAATSLCYGLVALLVLPADAARTGRKKDGQQAEKAAKQPAPGYRKVFADGRFVLVVLGLFLTSVAYIQMNSSLPLFVTDSGFDSRIYAVMLAINGGMVIALELWLSKWTQKAPIGIPMAAGMALLGLGYLTYLGPSMTWVLIAGTIVWTCGELVAAPSMLAYPGLVAPAELRGRYIGLATLATQIAYSAGPVVGVTAWHWWGTKLWVLTGACAGAAAVCVALGAGLRTRPKPRELHVSKERESEPA
ncbi:MFS transporter [Actinomadura rupiterrae]|uniref:MFS transporter n=1 Tax=Actinomadura rupiterrae TaxID=559627 RepID=UPI0020A408DC|nr:MFS transporter [Actinomadura rupiterrae]MCP2335920.1 MFS family permease [Actinomadura rupiterrae]